MPIRPSSRAPFRLRTVLMTAWLAMLGLLPMVLSHGIGSETQRPLALVVIGGLITATILTLYAAGPLLLRGHPPETGPRAALIAMPWFARRIVALVCLAVRFTGAALTTTMYRSTTATAPYIGSLSVRTRRRCQSSWLSSPTSTAWRISCPA